MTRRQAKPRPTRTVLKAPAVQAVSFFPSVSGGKYHAAFAGGELVAACDDTTWLKGRPVFEPVVVIVGQTLVHPVVCKRCLPFTQRIVPGLKS